MDAECSVCPNLDYGGDAVDSLKESLHDLGHQPEFEALVVLAAQMDRAEHQYWEACAALDNFPDELETVEPDAGSG